MLFVIVIVHIFNETRLTVLNWTSLRTQAQPHPALLLSEDKLEHEGVYFLPNYVALQCDISLQ